MTLCVDAHNHLCVVNLVGVHACRAVQCQQFEIALLLLEVGADPMYACTTDDGWESLPPLLAVTQAIPPGEHTLLCIAAVTFTNPHNCTPAAGMFCCMLDSVQQHSTWWQPCKA